MNMSNEEQRLESWIKRAHRAGYDARYEGQPLDTDPAPVSPQGAIARAWRDGWHKADGELK